MRRAPGRILFNPYRAAAAGRSRSKLTEFILDSLMTTGHGAAGPGERPVAAKDALMFKLGVRHAMLRLNFSIGTKPAITVGVVLVAGMVLNQQLGNSSGGPAGRELLRVLDVTDHPARECCNAT